MIQDDRLSSWNRRLHGAGCCVALVMTAAVYLTICRPLDQQASVLRRQIEGAEATIGEMERTRAQRDALQKRAQAVHDEIRMVLEQIPDSERESDFLAQLTDLADRVGLSILDFRPGATVERRDFSERIVDVAAEGNYASICRFLNELDGLPRLCSVVRMEVRGGGGESTGGGASLVSLAKGGQSNGTGPMYPVAMKLRIYFGPKRQAAGTSEGDHRG